MILKLREDRYMFASEWKPIVDERDRLRAENERLRRLPTEEEIAAIIRDIEENPEYPLSEFLMHADEILRLIKEKQA